MSEFMLRTKVVLLSTVMLTLAAGVTVGRLSAPPIVSTEAHPEQHHSKNPPWVADLGLNSDQQQKMDAIWQDTRKKIDVAMEGRKSLDTERQQAVRNLFTPDQQTAYDKIIADSRSKQAAFDKERQVLLDEGNAQTRALLDENQQKKWDVEIKEHQSHWHGNRGPSGQRSSTRPSNNSTATTQP
jgi:hypothetical protein